VSSSGLPSAGETWTCWNKSSDGDSWGLATSDIQEEAERAGSVQPEEGKVQRGLVNVYQYVIGRVKKMESDSSQWCPVTEREAEGTD